MRTRQATWLLLLFGAYVGFALGNPGVALAKIQKRPHVTRPAHLSHHRTVIRPARLQPLAHGILLKDLSTGRVLYAYNTGHRLSPASLTKIMTALIALEHEGLQAEVTATPEAVAARPTHLRLRAGQVFRLQDLLKGMLITSANDACLVLTGGLLPTLNLPARASSSREPSHLEIRCREYDGRIAGGQRDQAKIRN